MLLHGVDIHCDLPCRYPRSRVLLQDEAEGQTGSAAANDEAADRARAGAGDADPHPTRPPAVGSLKGWPEIVIDQHIEALVELSRGAS